MSRTDTIAMSAAVFGLAVILVAFVYDKANPSPLQWALGVAFALGLAVAAYLLLGLFAKHTNAQQAKAAQRIFEPLMPSGESLRAFVHGYTGPSRMGVGALLVGPLADALINGSRRKWYYIGVTQHYLALVQVDGQNGTKPTAAQPHLQHGDVQGVTFDSGGLKDARLILQFAAERMELRLESEMVNRAKTLVTAWNNIV